MIHTTKKWLIVMILAIGSLSLKAQTGDFTGTWQINHQQSIPKDSWEGVDKINIVQQNDQLIMTWFSVKEDGTKTETGKDTLIIDEKGKEFLHERNDGKIEKGIIKVVWSLDKKGIIRTAQNFLDDKETITFKSNYELSNEGKTLRMMFSDSGSKYAKSNVGVFTKE